MEVNKRNYGIDLLRMTAMFMIVCLHILGVGGVIEASSDLVINNRLAWLLEIFFYCAVNCYALISGYVGINSKYRYTNIIMLWLQVVFYMVVITVGCCIFTSLTIGYREIVRIFFPVMTGQYWYFTAYFLLFLVIPILNMAVNNIPKKRMSLLLIGLFISLSLFPTFIGKDIFLSGKGYSALWLMFLYLVGGYIKKYDLFSSLGNFLYFAGYLCAILFTFLFKLALERFNLGVFEKVLHPYMFVEYTSPTILLASICLLLAFSRLRLKKFEGFIKFMAPLSFSVYLIHSNILLGEVAWTGKFAFLGKLSPILMVISVLGLGLLIYFVCSMCDLVRLFIFKKLQIKERLLVLEKKYVGDATDN